MWIPMAEDSLRSVAGPDHVTLLTMQDWGRQDAALQHTTLRYLCDMGDRAPIRGQCCSSA